MRSFILISVILVLSSCVPMKDSTTGKNGLIKNSSVFANVNELGKSKSDFVSKYGNAINKDLIKEGSDLIETLYYVENIDQVLVTTKIKFINDRVVEQSNSKMEYSPDKRIKELQKKIDANALENFNNQLLHKN